MGKSLSEMTLEELWQLFPIVLEAPAPQWRQWYAEELALLQPLLPPGTRLSHIGSTAINGWEDKEMLPHIGSGHGGTIRRLDAENVGMV